MEVTMINLFNNWTIKGVVAEDVEIQSSTKDERKSIELEIDIDNTIPAVYVDENRFIQILYNLIGNAIKFTDKGVISISAMQKGDMVEINITDTGIGIPKEKQEDIFKSFEQVDSSDKKKYSGTGLGLFITKQLVDTHGGTIDVESQVDKGSRFFFTLPKTEEKPEVILPELDEKLARIIDDSETKQVDSAAEKKDSDSKFFILTVDDDPINQQVLMNHLSSEGYRFKQLYSGDEALQYLEKNENPDLILLDIMMPGMSGHMMLRVLKIKRFLMILLK